jgi:hypothetical protein
MNQRKCQIDTTTVGAVVIRQPYGNAGHPGANRRIALAWCVAALFLLGVWGGVAIAVGQGADQPPAPAVVRLTIDYGDGVEKHFSKIPWREGMTVLDALTEARKHPRGIRFESRGKGETAFVSQIDDLKNEGQGRNWLFQVNDKAGTTSCGIHRVARDDRILWKFDTYR